MDSFSMTPCDSYDPIAWFYCHHWAHGFETFALHLLERTLLPHVPPQGRLLDLCCGVGNITAALAQRGYRMTGLDASQEMLAFARERLPEAELVTADARSFELPPRFDGVLSTFDSLNHVLSADDLGRVFANVRRCLVPGGAFAFDMNVEEAYRTGWRHSASSVAADHAWFMRGGYDEQRQLGTTLITVFRPGTAGWTREDATIRQRCYERADVERLLQHTGFSDVNSQDAQIDLGFSDDWAVGRRVYTARRPDAPLGFGREVMDAV